MSLLFRHSRFRLARSISCALLLLALSAATARAVPLIEYRSRVEQALIELYDLWEEEDPANTSADKARINAAFEKVKKLLPAEETVEWGDGLIRVNNKWLAEELKNYQELPAIDERRGEIIYGVVSRLEALQERFGELDVRGPGAGLNKQQQKPRLEAILRREEYKDKSGQKGAIALFWERVKRWLSDLLSSINPLRPGKSWLSFLVMLLIFALAAWLIIYATLKLLPIFRARSKRGLGLEKRGPRFVLGERLGPEQTAASILNEAEELARRGEWRAAIRKGYVALLCELGERKIISLAGHKTNHDYLRAVREKRPLLNEMQKLTASYENHWYGFLPASSNDWSAFRSGYQQTLKTATLLKDEG